MATSEDELVALDFVQGDVCYALKRHDPELGRHFKGRSPQEIKAEVLASPRLQRVMQEVIKLHAEIDVWISCSVVPPLSLFSMHTY